MAEMYQNDQDTTPKVTAVIVTFQSRDTIGEVLEIFQDLHQQNSADVVVTDNNSTDGTADFIAQAYPFVQLIRNRENIGFGRGCNCGFDFARTPYILLINPDAKIDKDSLDILMDFMEAHPRVGICGPAVVDESGALQPSGGSPTPWKAAIKPLLPGLASRGQRSIIPGETPRATDWICGSVMLLRSQMIKEIGGFDPRFFLYFEETDMCRRAMKAGWEIWTVGTAVAGHVNAASAKSTSAEMIWGTISEHYFRSRLYFFRKHFGLPAAVFAEIGELCSMLLRAALDLLRGRTYKHLRPRLRAPILKFPDVPKSDTGVSLKCRKR